MTHGPGTPGEAAEQPLFSGGSLGRPRPQPGVGGGGLGGEGGGLVAWSWRRPRPQQGVGVGSKGKAEAGEAESCRGSVAGGALREEGTMCLSAAPSSPQIALLGQREQGRLGATEDTRP